VGFCGGQSGAGVGFLRVLRSPLPIFIPPIAPKILLIYHHVGRGARAVKAHPLYIHTYMSQKHGELKIKSTLTVLEVNPVVERAVKKVMLSL
jgi:hypothetical protein